MADTVDRASLRFVGSDGILASSASRVLDPSAKEGGVFGLLLLVLDLDSFLGDEGLPLRLLVSEEWDLSLLCAAREERLRDPADFPDDLDTLSPSSRLFDLLELEK